jgi:LCP family protein required for cell wall assembly
MASREHTRSDSTSLVRRVFTAANLVALVVAVVVLYVGLLIEDAHLWVVVWTIVAAGAGAAVWYLIDRQTSEPPLGSVLTGIPYLGSIPSEGTGPAPTIEEGPIADRYLGLLREIEGQTTGRVLLVSSPGPGQGASSVSMNLAIAATKAGRRVMLVDADPSPTGIGRFLSSGPSPGLSDVAAGSATLAQASRMWTLEDGTQFPMLPSGAEPADAHDLAGILVADAFDTVSEHADLIIIDVPPVLWSDATPDLGAHADGTILVMTDTASTADVAAAIDQLSSAGAPVLGYVRNRSAGTTPLEPHRLRHAAKRAAILAVALVVGYGTYTGVQLVNAWNRVETQALDTGAVAAMGQSDEPAEAADPEDDVQLDDDTEPAKPPITTPTEAYETVLIIGNDLIANASDVILYLVRPTNGADPFMVSLPRDLYVENPCTKGHSRINALIKGCPSKDINGPTLLSYAVGSITGIEVDHFAWFNFESFTNIINAVGGVEICVDYPVRDPKAELDLPAGCTQATGEQALSWVRSRKTEQYVDGVWQSVPGASDLQRNQHQQEVILQMFAKLKSFDSLSQLTTKAASLADNFILDDGLSIPKAVNLAWSLRGIELEDIKRLEIPVRLTRSKSGQSILVATESFDNVLAAEYGNSLPTEDGSQDSAASDDSGPRETAPGIG